MSSTTANPAISKLGTARVLRVEEQICEVWRDGTTSAIGYAPMFPAPRTERVSPGHLVAIASGTNGVELVVWRWYDAVVLGRTADGAVRLWEPAHGEVIALARESYDAVDPGGRAWASAGLPGAEWWVAGPAEHPEPAVELAAVAALYTDNDLWTEVFDTPPGLVGRPRVDPSHGDAEASR